jgi:hypothetical protein
MNQEKSYFAGWHPLPDLTAKEEKDLANQQFHKLRKGAHVQAMEQLVNASHSVPPTEINGAVLTFEGEEAQGGDQAYAILNEDPEDGSLTVRSIFFLGAYPDGGAVRALSNKTKDQLIQERFSRVPPRSVLP